MSLKSAIPAAAFRRLCIEISSKFDMTLRSDAINLLQRASEDVMVTLFRAASVIATHADRLTVNRSDLQTSIAVAEIMRPNPSLVDLSLAFSSQENKKKLSKKKVLKLREKRRSKLRAKRRFRASSNVSLSGEVQECFGH